MLQKNNFLYSNDNNSIEKTYICYCWYIFLNNFIVLLLLYSYYLTILILLQLQFLFYYTSLYNDSNISKYFKENYLQQVVLQQLVQMLWMATYVLQVLELHLFSTLKVYQLHFLLKILQKDVSIQHL